jgi:hypothetical protein
MPCTAALLGTRTITQTLTREVPVLVLLAIVVVLFVGLLLAVDRAVKVSKRVRRRQEANRRLMAAAAVAEDQNRRRTAAAESSKALTSLIPAIHEHDIRHVD